MQNIERILKTESLLFKNDSSRPSKSMLSTRGCLPPVFGIADKGFQSLVYSVLFRIAVVPAGEDMFCLVNRHNVIPVSNERENCRQGVEHLDNSGGASAARR